MAFLSVPASGWVTTVKDWMTTGDVARALGLTPDGVRWLARDGRINYVATRSGQRLFPRREVTRVLLARAEARVRRRTELLAAVRPQMVRVVEPRQAQFRFVQRKVT